MVGQTILRQLGGGRRFGLMTGASMYVIGDDDLTFDLPLRSTKNKTNKVKIALAADDTYTITFYNYNRRTLDLKTIETIEGVYADNLREVFTDRTGLYTSLAG